VRVGDLVRYKSDGDIGLVLRPISQYIFVRWNDGWVEQYYNRKSSTTLLEVISESR